MKVVRVINLQAMAQPPALDTQIHSQAVVHIVQVRTPQQRVPLQERLILSLVSLRSLREETH